MSRYRMLLVLFALLVSIALVSCEELQGTPDLTTLTPGIVLPTGTGSPVAGVGTTTPTVVAVVVSPTATRVTGTVVATLGTGTPAVIVGTVTPTVVRTGTPPIAISTGTPTLVRTGTPLLGSPTPTPFIIGGTPAATATPTVGATTILPTLTRTPGVTGITGMDAALEQALLAVLIPHQQWGISLSRIAQQVAERPELRTFAMNTIRSEEAELDLLLTWSSRWNGTPTPATTGSPTPLCGPTVGNLPDVSAYLRQQNVNLDQSYVEEMILHQESAIRLTQLLQQLTTRNEVRDLARITLANRQRDLDQLYSWRQSWFNGLPAPTPTVAR